jgi:hypothetical protein
VLPEKPVSASYSCLILPPVQCIPVSSCPLSNGCQGVLVLKVKRALGSTHWRYKEWCTYTSDPPHTSSWHGVLTNPGDNVARRLCRPPSLYSDTASQLYLHALLLGMMGQPTAGATCFLTLLTARKRSAWIQLHIK